MAVAVEASGVEKVWLKSYPAGVPGEVRLDEFASIRSILEKSCEKFAELPAYTCMGRTLSYAQVDGLSRDFASWLQNAAGLAKGARVALMMPNLLSTRWPFSGRCAPGWWS